MRILVLWEHEREQQDAENLANVLVNLAPSLAADAVVGEGGSVEMRFGRDRGVPKVLVRVASWQSYFDQLMRSLLEV
jgi:hypothetical protein